MKRLIMLILLCCFTFAITTAAFSQLYFEDNFDNPSKSEKSGLHYGEPGNLKTKNTINS